MNFILFIFSCYIVIVHIYGAFETLQHTYKKCNNQIRVIGLWFSPTRTSRSEIRILIGLIEYLELYHVNKTQDDITKLQVFAKQCL